MSAIRVVGATTLRRFALTLAGLVGLLVVAGCTPPSGSTGPGGGPTTRQAAPVIRRTIAGIPVVRVRLLENLSSVKLTSAADPAIRMDDSNPGKLALGGKTVEISLSGPAWSIGGAQVSRGTGPGILELSPTSAMLVVNGAAYRGKFRLIPVAGNRFDAINDVDVDDYLKSVVSRELYRDWQPETYRAQAIVARTYAMYEVATNPPNRSWDVYPDTRSQVYGGVTAETQKSIDAVVSTRGIVCAFGPFDEERIFKAYFSACCGGIGQSAADAFGDAPLPPLAEKNPGALCSASPRYTWGPVTLTKPEVTRRIRLWARQKNRPEAAIGDVRQIAVSGKNRFGRPVRFEVTDARGQRFSLTSEELRWALNGGGESRSILSSYLSVADTGASFSISGHGSGHGVGFCQYCAEALAERGKRHEDIVRYSFPGSRLVKAY